MECSGKRDAIIQMTMELVAENGFHGTPMSQVAKRAGVAAGTIYHYFESKDALIKDAYNHLEGHILAYISEEYPAGRPVRERFKHIGRGLIAVFIKSPMQFCFFEQFHNSPFGAANRRDRILGKNGNNIVTTMFEDALKQQVIKELPLPLLFALAFGPLLQISRDHIFGLIVLDEILAEKMVDACWDSIKR